MAKRISIEQAFLWMQAFLQREWRLLLPVALAFLALPSLAVDLLVPPERRTIATPVSPDQLTAVLAWMLPSVAVLLVGALVGGLAITALAIVPRISVQEAIRVALRRLPVPLGVLLLVAVALGIAATAASAVVLLLGTSLLQAMLVVRLLLVAAAVFVSVRLMLLSPLVVDRPVGVIAALKGAWAASEALFWRLLGASLLFLAGALVVLLAVQWAFGSLLLALGLAIGQPELGHALAGLASACASAAVSTAFTVLVAGLYHQVAPAHGAR